MDLIESMRLQRAAERFFRKVSMQPSGCLLWDGGAVFMGVTPARWAYATGHRVRLTNSDIVIPSCGHRNCVLLDHLQVVQKGSRSSRPLQPVVSFNYEYQILCEELTPVKRGWLLNQGRPSLRFWWCSHTMTVRASVTDRAGWDQLRRVVAMLPKSAIIVGRRGTPPLEGSEGSSDE